MFFENVIRKVIDKIYMWVHNVNRWAYIHLYMYVHKSHVSVTDTYF